LAGTLTLFLVLQNIGLPESNYVQIALFGMVLSGTMGFHPDKTIIFNDNMASFTTYDACSCIIASAKSVTVPWESLSLILITRAWVLGPGE
jgi:hypothetical protein